MQSPLARYGLVSPLVGRESQLASLRAVVERAIAYQAPQLVTVLGNRGTGKTRLLGELAAALPDGVRVLHGRAEEGVRHGAIASLLHGWLELADDADEATTRARLGEVCSAAFADERAGEMSAFLGTFLGLRVDGSPFLRLFDEEEGPRDEVARLLLRRFIDADATRAPLVLVLDDLQLAGDETLDLVEELAEGLAGAPVVVVASARADLLARRPSFGHAGDTTHVELANLPPAQATEMLRKLLQPCERVPQGLIADAVEMTGGNPLLVEELVALWLDSGSLDTHAMPWRIDAPRAGAIELQVSVEQAIEARIAALSHEERDLLEKAAVFGSVFWLSGIVALTRVERHAAGGTNGWADDDLSGTLSRVIDSLGERDYVLRLPGGDSSIPGDVEVVFKHNLERDLVSRLTDAPRRKRLSRIGAQWLEIKLPERSAEQLEFLGQLYENGGDARRAAVALLAAADKARDRYANPSSVELYRRALALLSDDDVQPRLEALHNLGTVLVLVGQNEEATACFEQMLRLAWLFDHPAKAGAAHGRIGRIHRGRGEYEEALSRFQKARELFERAGDRRGVAGTLDDVGIVHWLRGAYPTALEQHKQALAIRRTLGDKRSVALSLANMGRVHHDMGAFQSALERFREALEIRRHIGDRTGVVSSMVDLGTVHEADGKLEAAQEIFGDALKLAKEIGDRQAQAQVLGRMGEVLLAMGRSEAAVDALAKAQELMVLLGDRAGQSQISRRLAEASLAVGDRAAAGQHARRSFDLAHDIGSRVHAGAALRVLAEVAAAGDLASDVSDVGEAQPRDDGARAEELFLQAVKLLGEVQNDLELARAYRAFAAFRERSGHPAEAVKLRIRADEIFGRLRGAASGSGQHP